MIRNLIEAGVNVFRLNFSHGDREMHKRNIQFIRQESEKLGAAVAILQDLQGPKIRTGIFEEGRVLLEEGQKFVFTCDDDSPGDETRGGVTYTGLCGGVENGDTIPLEGRRRAVLVTETKAGGVEREVRQSVD